MARRVQEEIAQRVMHPLHSMKAEVFATIRHDLTMLSDLHTLISNQLPSLPSLHSLVLPRCARSPPLIVGRRPWR